MNFRRRTLAIIAHPPMWLVLVLFCVFGIAMYSG
jgi:putative MFS transporter